MSDAGTTSLNGIVAAGDVPAGIVDWVRRTIGGTWSIKAFRSLDASSATVLAVDIERDGTTRHLVLRVHDRAWFVDEPEAPPREVAALAVLGGTDLPAPRLVGWSEHEPAAVLMTLIPGVPDLAIRDAGAVRDVLDGLHALPTDGLSAWSYRGYHEGIELVRPAWWRDAAIWERAVRQTETNRPAVDPVVIHRDFHPGNLLWVDGRLSGIVDWVSACVGPAAFDASHLRVNLAVLHGPDEPDRVITADPAWDIEAAFGFLDSSSTAAIDSWGAPWPHLPADMARARLEAFVADALARLG